MESGRGVDFVRWEARRSYTAEPNVQATPLDGNVALATTGDQLDSGSLGETGLKLRRRGVHKGRNGKSSVCAVRYWSVSFPVVGRM